MVASHYYLWLEPGGAFLVMRMRLFQSSIDGKGPKRTYKDSASWKIGRLHAMKLFLNHFALEEHKLFVSLIPNEAMLIVSCGMVIDRGK